MTIKEANKALLAILPKQSFSIEFEFWNHYIGLPREDEAAWSVWDGKKHHKSATLATAVQMCLEEHNGCKANLDQAQEEICHE